MDLYTATGEKVTFIGKNGYDEECNRANKVFVVGEPLTVKTVDVGGWSSTVTFEEVPGMWNTVMFSNLGTTWKREDWFGLNYPGYAKSQEEIDALEFQPNDMYEPPKVEAANEGEFIHVPEVDEAPKATKLNQLTVASLGSNKLAVLNPKDEAEVIELFMARFGYEPNRFNSVWFENTFDPAVIGGSSFCDCDY